MPLTLLFFSDTRSSAIGHFWNIRLRHVSQRKEHSDQKQRVGAIQQPRSAAHRPASPHVFHGGARKRGQHGERLLGRPQLFPPRAAVQGAQRCYKHVAHHAGWSHISNPVLLSG